MRMDLRMRLFTAGLHRAGTLAVDRMSPEQLRKARREIMHNPVTDVVTGRVPGGVRTEDRQVPTRDGACRVRVYRPSARGPLPLVVNYHGGGWVLGNLTQADWLCGEVAARTSAVVVSVDYRLAPEHPYPAGLHDAVDGLRWAVGAAGELGVDPARVATMGDSAGGNLAAVVPLVLQEEGGPSVEAQVLVYPAVDLTPQSPSHGLLPDAPVLPKTSRDAFLEHYLQSSTDDPVDPYDPRLSPLRAPSHAGLPRALIVCAEHDPLTAEGRAYADALAAADVPVRYVEMVGMPHGFVSFPGVSRAAPQALAEIVAFLRDDVPGMRPLSRPRAAATGG